MFIIVRNAGESWPQHWTADPKQTPQHIVYAAGHSYMGIRLQLPVLYHSADAALPDVAALNAANPGWDYAVCPVKTEYANHLDQADFACSRFKLFGAEEARAA